MARTSQGARIDALRESIDNLKGSVDTLHIALAGDITTDKPGLFMRVDRLEQVLGAFRWMLMLIIAALVPLAINSCQQRSTTEAEHSNIVEGIENIPGSYDVLVPTETPTPTATPSMSYSEMRKELTELRERNEELEAQVERLLELLEKRDDARDNYLPALGYGGYVPGYSSLPWNDVQGCGGVVLPPYVTRPLWVRYSLWERRGCVLGIASRGG